MFTALSPVPLERWFKNVICLFFLKKTLSGFIWSDKKARISTKLYANLQSVVEYVFQILNFIGIHLSRNIKDDLKLDWVCIEQSFGCPISLLDIIWSNIKEMPSSLLLKHYC